MEGIEFCRCRLCGAVVSPWDIKEKHGCPKCGHARVSPANLTFFEKIAQVAKHPKVWEWGRMNG